MPQVSLPFIRDGTPPVAARLAGDCDLEGADAGKPDCYGMCGVF
jgi:hypothetical protein